MSRQRKSAYVAYVSIVAVAIVPGLCPQLSNALIKQYTLPDRNFVSCVALVATHET